MMLDPKLGNTLAFPRPTRIISKSSLHSAWRQSRDATGTPGRPGVDGVSAKQFAANLDANLANVARRLKDGTFGFSKLRPVFVPKPNSDKERMICVPTVCDRLVQRVIVDYLTARKLFPIYNTSSFGFIKGLGTREAIKAVTRLREEYDWCLKTDIEAFFDRIPRNYLKLRVLKCLGHHSLTPLVSNAIDCEAKVRQQHQRKWERQGIRRGRGIRQGMPLSPLLANLVLSDFDRQVGRANIPVVRYADDLVLFYRSKDEAKDGENFVRNLLKSIQLNIPRIDECSKTVIVPASDPLSFLGREIVHLGKENAYVARVSGKQLEKIKVRLMDEFSFLRKSQSGKTLHDTIIDLSRSISAYLGIYMDAYNCKHLESELHGHSRAIISGIFRDIFGEDSLNALTDEGRKFLGMEIWETIRPNPELEF